MATTETSFAQELIEMILRSETIALEQQQSYIERIAKGEFTEEMQQELATIFENEMRRLDGKIGTISQGLAAAEAEFEEEWKQIEPEMQRISEEDKAETAQAVADFKAECDQAEKGVETDVEGAEQAEAEGIRESLKKEQGE